MTTAPTTPALPMGMEGVKQRPEWQTRVIEERYDLSEKLNRLLRALAMGGPAGEWSDEDEKLLRYQAKAMRRYLRILDQRMDRFMPAVRR